MGFLFELDTPVIVALVVSFYVVAGGQLLHVLFLSTRCGARPFSLVKLYEVLLFVHLLLAAATANSVHSGYGVALFRLKATQWGTRTPSGEIGRASCRERV